MTAHPPATDPANDVPQDRRAARRHLQSALRRGDRRDREAGDRRPDHPLEPDERPVRRHRLPGQPHAPSVLGIKAYPSSSAIREPIDLAVIVTPAKTVPGLIAGVRRGGDQGGVIISRRVQGDRPRGRGTRAAGARGGAAATASALIGPNCLGVMSPIGRMNATFAAGIASPAGGLHQPVGRALHGRSRLGDARERGLQLHSCASARCSTSAGAT